MHRRFHQNKTLFGLRTNTPIKIKYDIKTRKVVEICGIQFPENINVEISDDVVFNIPEFIALEGVQFYPSKYESFNQGHIFYHVTRPPLINISIVGIDDVFGYRTKFKSTTVTPEALEQLDNSMRRRIPAQLQVMGESAAFHAKRLIDKGNLVVGSEFPVNWHWCHLLAFSLMPTSKAQHRSNLVCGTSACNGHMANVEAAVKLFIYETGLPLNIEVTATVIAGTDVATRVRYRVYAKKSGMVFTDYFDALTDIASDYGDFQSVDSRLKATYTEFKRLYEAGKL